MAILVSAGIGHRLLVIDFASGRAAAIARADCILDLRGPDESNFALDRAQRIGDFLIRDRDARGRRMTVSEPNAKHVGIDQEIHYRAVL